MEISWYGHSCFRLAERGKATIITDPFDDTIGYGLPKLKAEVTTISHEAPGHSNIENVKNVQRVINGPGEYEIGGVFIIGAAMHNLESDPPKRNVAYMFDFDGLNIVHLGDLDHVPAQSTIEAMGAVDIALVPVGAGGGLNATQAAEVVGLLEPSIVIHARSGNGGTLSQGDGRQPHSARSTSKSHEVQLARTDSDCRPGIHPVAS